MQPVIDWIQNNRLLSAALAGIIAYVVVNYRAIIARIPSSTRTPINPPHPLDAVSFVPLDEGTAPYAPDRATMFVWLDHIRDYATANNNRQAVDTTNKLINDLFTFDPASVASVSITTNASAPIPGPVPPRMT